jgi:hypothetical protein
MAEVPRISTSDRLMNGMYERRFQFGMRTLLVLVALVGVVSALVVAGIRTIQNEKGPRRPFDVILWKQAAPTRQCQRTVRSEMVDDLLKEHDFTGYSRAEVVGLLGSPSPRWSGFEQWDMYYVLGLERAGVLLWTTRQLDSSSTIADELSNMACRSIESV